MWARAASALAAIAALGRCGVDASAPLVLAPQDLILYYTVRDLGPAGCMPYQELLQYHPTYPQGDDYAPGSTFGAGATSGGDYYCPLYNDIVSGAHSGHADFEQQYGTYADGCSGSPANKYLINNLTSYGTGYPCRVDSTTATNVITSIVEEDLAFGFDGLPKPIYCDPTKRNPPGFTTDSRCGWGDGSTTQGTYSVVSTNNKTMFDLWYNDNPKYNMRSGGVLPVPPLAGSPGFYQFSSPAASPTGSGWHPLDRLPVCKQSNYKLDCSNGGRHFPLQELEGYDETANNHTFSFTTEIHTFFTYTGINQSFEFSGDDDLWVFINNKLAVDVGGLHPRSEAKVDLTHPYVANYLGLQVGGIYPLDLFNAERHSTGSNFKITTSLTFECSILNSGQVVYSWNPASLQTDWKLVGGFNAATVSGQRIQLASSTEPNLASYAFLRQKVNVAPGFVINFAFTASSKGSGFVFGLLPQRITDLNGGSGHSLGFRNMNASWAIAFDFCTDRALNESFPPCNAREIRMHYLDSPTSPSNVSLSTRRLFSTLYLPNTLNDGLAHNIRIRYFGQRPPWIEVYIDESLFLQQRGINLVNVLDAKDAWVGFTSSTGLTSSERSDIFITNFNVVAVAIADQNTKPYNMPNQTQSAVADGHHALSFSVQNFDLCGNSISFGGHSDRAYAFLSLNSPSAAPSSARPSSSPTLMPTLQPTGPTTLAPTHQPSRQTTRSPTPPTAHPSASPTRPTTAKPTHSFGRMLVDEVDFLADDSQRGVEESLVDSVATTTTSTAGAEARHLVTSQAATGNYTVPANVVDNGDGTYSFVFNTTSSGLYDLHMYYGVGCFVGGNQTNGLASYIDPNTCFSTVVYAVAEFFPTTPAPTFGQDAQSQPLGTAALSGIGVAAGVIATVGCMLIFFGIRVRNRWRRDKEFIEAGRIAAAERGVEYLGDNELDRLQNQLQKTLEEIQKERAKKAMPDDQQDTIRALLKQKGELQETVRQLKIKAQGGDPSAVPADTGPLARVRKSFAYSKYRASSGSTGGQHHHLSTSLQADNPAFQGGGGGGLRASIGARFWPSAAPVASSTSSGPREVRKGFQQMPAEPEI